MSDFEKWNQSPYQTPSEVPERPPLFEDDGERPWGPWWALLWSFVVICVWALAQFGIMAFLSFQESGAAGLTSEGLEQFGEMAMADGDILGMVGFGSAVIGCAVILLIVRVKGVSFAKGLSLRRPRKWWMWLLLFPGYLLGGYLIALVTTPLQTEKAASDQANIAAMVGNTDAIWLLFLGVSVGAPLFEEFLFRGLLHEGLRQSVLGRVGSGLLTAALFSVVHGQYEDPSAFVALFMLGCYFTLARELTGSLWASVVMHFIQNTIVTVTMVLGFKGLIPDDQMPDELREIFQQELPAEVEASLRRGDCLSVAAGW